MTTLWSFTGGEDGANPYAGLVQGSDGSFYGTTKNGGGDLKGTVFSMTTGAGLATLATFSGYDGGFPEAGLVQGSDGNFYGTTRGGGDNDVGTVFQFTPGNGLTTLWSFTGGEDGAYPTAGLVQGFAMFAVTSGMLPPGLTLGTNGALTGMPTAGGSYMFTVTATDAYGCTNTISYTISINCANITVSPSSLPAAQYDTTYNQMFTASGGAPPYSFMVTPGTSLPEGLTLGSDGSLTGASVTPGDASFSVTTTDANGCTSSTACTLTVECPPIILGPTSLPAGQAGVIYKKTITDSGPGGTPILYGTTSSGAGGYGTVFQVTPDGALTTLVIFTGNGGDCPGAGPFAGLVQAKDGNFYGTTFAGGTNENGIAVDIQPYGIWLNNTNSGYGTVFKMTPGGLFTTLASFDMYPHGGNPFAGLVQGRDGNFYGTALEGGASDYGTVFEMTPDGVLTTLWDFTNGIDGAYPAGGVIQANDDYFYGTTKGYTDNRDWSGEINGESDGTVFQWAPGVGLTTVWTFSGGTDGAWPGAGLLQDAAFNFYGTTFLGGTGASSGGSVFQLIPTGEYGGLSTFYSFDLDFGVDGDGQAPGGAVAQGTDFNYYVTTSYGGGTSVIISALGTLDEISTNGAETTLATFDGPNGSYPEGAVIQASDGNFYGTTFFGGTNGDGTVFQWTPGVGGGLTSLVSFTGGYPTLGANPSSTLVQRRDTIRKFKVTAGAPPPGLTLGSDGVLTGIPTTSGITTFTVTATDPYGCTAETTYTLTNAPAITPVTSSLHGTVFTWQYTSATELNYLVLTSTNPALPLSKWRVVGAPTLSNNVYQFTDPNATNQQQYYILQSQ